jgi:lysozyme
MTPFDDLRLSEGAHREHGRHTVYRCPAGKLTIGYGRNLEARGLSDEEADTLAVNDIAANVATCIAAVGIEAWNAMADDLSDGATELADADWWRDQAEHESWWPFYLRHRALLELAHGLGSFTAWPRFIAAVNAGDYNAAADELLWADAAHTRHTLIFDQWRTGQPGEQRLERIVRRLKTGEE